MPESPSRSTRPSTPRPSEARRRVPGRKPWSWRRAMGLGLCFGLGYGLTMRLLDLSLGGVWRDMQRFGVQSFPGTELDSLRKQFGDRQEQIRGDLDLLELERQQKRNAEELGKRQAEMADREQEQQQNEEDRQRLDAQQQDNQDSVPSPALEPAQESLPSAPAPLTTPPPLPTAPPPALPSAEAPATNSPTTP